MESEETSYDQFFCEYRADQAMKSQRRLIPKKTMSQKLVLHAHPHSIRRFHIKAYQTQVASFQQAAEKMRRYVEHDQPAFTLWWQQEFAAALSGQSLLEKTLHDLQLLVDATDLYVSHKKGTHARAYALVTKAQAEGKLSQLMAEIFADIDRLKKVNAVTEEFSTQTRASRVPFEQASFPQEHDLLTPVHIVAGPTAEETTEGYIKKIYRELVRKLHPDTTASGQQNAQQKSLWHELQNAYEWRDLDRLEALFKRALGPSAEAIDFATVPIGDILAMKEEMIRKLTKLRKDMKRAKKEANWDFGARRQDKRFMKGLATSIEEELSAQTRHMESRIERYQKLIQSWIAPVKNRKQKSYRYEAQDHDSW